MAAEAMAVEVTAAAIMAVGAITADGIVVAMCSSASATGPLGITLGITRHHTITIRRQADYRP